MPEEEKIQPEHGLEDAESNSPVEVNEDEDSVSDDPIGDTSDDDGEADARSSKEGTDPVTRAILAEREAATYRERLSYLDQQATKAQNDSAERERMSLMSDSEKAEYIFGKMQNFANTQQQQLDAKLRFASFDVQDRTSFINKYGNHTAYNKLAAQVETKYAEVVSKGNQVSRKDIFGWLLGQKQLAAIERGTGTKQKNKGATNVQKAKANGSAGKSDFQKVGAPKGNDFAAIKARLAAGRSAYNN